MAGYSHESFWDQTPRTIQITFDAHQERQIREHNQRAWQAHTTAALQRTKRFPSLSKLELRQPKRKSMDEQIAGLIDWVRATGGQVIYKDKVNG